MIARVTRRLDVFNTISSKAFETGEIAAAVARDASLSADILRLANSRRNGRSPRRTGRPAIRHPLSATGAWFTNIVSVDFFVHA